MASKQAEATRRWEAKNPEKRKEYDRIKRERHPEIHRKANLKWQRNNRDAMRKIKRDHVHRRTQRLREMKESSPCSDCGGFFHFSAMDYDHVRGEKFRSVGQMLQYTWERVLEEIAKCELVCANCHRVRTWNRRNAR